MSDVVTPGATMGGPVSNSQEHGKKQTNVELPTSNGALDIQLISIGQGGASMATKIKEVMGIKNEIIAINTSDQDLSMLEVPDEFKMKIGGANIQGAGKVRARSKEYYKNFQGEVKQTGTSITFIEAFMALYEELLFGIDQKIIFVCFTSAGGSGSGIGPIFTTMLSNHINKKNSFIMDGREFVIDDTLNTVPRPVVCGITAIPDIDEGIMSLQNGIECCSELQGVIDKRLASFFIVNNTLKDIAKPKDDRAYYDIVNSRFAFALLKFLGMELNSDTKCVDTQDKISSLRIPGIHSFVGIDDTHNMFQYVVPFNQAVTRAVSMINVKTENANEVVERKLRSLDIVSDDKISGLFNPSLTRFEIGSVASDLIEKSMIGLFGFKNLNTITEPLKDKLHNIIKSNKEKNDTAVSSGTGFDSLKDDGQQLNTMFTSETVSDDDISDMF